MAGPAQAIPDAAPPRALISVTGFDPLNLEGPGPVGCHFIARGSRSHNTFAATTDLTATAHSECFGITLSYVDATPSISGVANGVGSTKYCNSSCTPLPRAESTFSKTVPLTLDPASAHGAHTAIASSPTFVWVGYDQDQCQISAQVVPGVGIGSAISCTTKTPIG